MAEEVRARRSVEEYTGFCTSNHPPDDESKDVHVAELAGREWRLRRGVSIW
jgi:hypothetical protein